MKVGFDLDGVLAQTYTGFINYVNRVHDWQVEQKRATEYDLSKCLYPKGSGPLHEKDFWAVFEDFMVDKGHNIQPAPNSYGPISRLANEHELNIVTARTGKNRPGTYQWVERHFPKMFTGIYFYTDKGQATRELGLDIFIEDCLDNAESVAAAGRPVIIFDAPYNQSDKFIRAYNMTDVECEINLENGKRQNS